MPDVMYVWIADLILVVHVLVAAFIVFGLVLVLVGKATGWGWVRNPGFRWLHLMAITVVVLQSWLGKVCPLTTWEMALRAKAGDASYDGSFIAHWLGEILFYQAPPGVFVVAYTLFGGLVVFAWMWVRPDPLRKGADRHPY
jgi:hypothetical protein